MIKNPCYDPEPLLWSRTRYDPEPVKIQNPCYNPCYDPEPMLKSRTHIMIQNHDPEPVMIQNPYYDPGDQVLEWNGVSLTGRTYEEVQQIISAPNGEIELVVRP